MELTHYLRIQAHANRLSNQRLHAAMAPLTHAEFHAPRTSFFPSLAQTLNHILEVDLYYVGALHGDPDLRATTVDGFVASDELAALAARQAASDSRLIAFCDALDAAALDREVQMPRATHIQRDRVGHVLAHLFNHQTHHRGQAHALLSAIAGNAAAPSLDLILYQRETGVGLS